MAVIFIYFYYFILLYIIEYGMNGLNMESLGVGPDIIDYICTYTPVLHMENFLI